MVTLELRWEFFTGIQELDKAFQDSNKNMYTKRSSRVEKVVKGETSSRPENWRDLRSKPVEGRLMWNVDSRRSKSEEIQVDNSCWRFNSKIRRVNNTHHNSKLHDSPNELGSNEIKPLNPSQLRFGSIIKTSLNKQSRIRSGPKTTWWSLLRKINNIRLVNP